MSGAVFELWGLPGAGKSTVASALAIRGNVSVQPLVTFSKSIVQYPLRALLLWGWLVSVGLGQRSLVRVAIRQMATERKHNRNVIIEEGLVHELWRVLFANPSRVSSRAWRTCLRQSSSRIIILDVTPEHARARMRGKARPGPINRLLRDEALDGLHWKAASDAYSALLRELRLSADRQVHECEVKQADVDEVCSWIERAVLTTTIKRP